jgi:hypothetical protein
MANSVKLINWIKCKLGRHSYGSLRRSTFRDVPTRDFLKVDKELATIEAVCTLCLHKKIVKFGDPAIAIEAWVPYLTDETGRNNYVQL